MTYCTGILQVPAPTFEIGLLTGPTDLVANTGILFSLDNGLSNSAGLTGLYPPDHANGLAGFGNDTPVAITLEVI